jgi:hypothetical protein
MKLFAWIASLFTVTPNTLEKIRVEETPEVGSLTDIDGTKYLAVKCTSNEDTDENCDGCAALNNDEDDELCSKLPMCENIIYVKATQDVIEATNPELVSTYEAKTTKFGAGANGAAGKVEVSGQVGTPSKEVNCPVDCIDCSCGATETPAKQSHFTNIKNKLGNTAVGDTISRTLIMKGLNPSEKITMDNYRNWFSQAGYITKADGSGSYTKLKQVPIGITSNQLRKEAYTKA